MKKFFQGLDSLMEIVRTYIHLKDSIKASSFAKEGGFKLKAFGLNQVEFETRDVRTRLFSEMGRPETASLEVDIRSRDCQESLTLAFEFYEYGLSFPGYPPTAWKFERTPLGYDPYLIIMELEDETLIYNIRLGQAHTLIGNDLLEGGAPGFLADIQALLALRPICKNPSTGEVEERILALSRLRDFIRAFDYRRFGEERGSRLKKIPA